jgi:PAS domain S-box-containing protein
MIELQFLLTGLVALFVTIYVLLKQSLRQAYAHWFLFGFGLTVTVGEVLSYVYVTAPNEASAVGAFRLLILSSRLGYLLLLLTVVNVPGRRVMKSLLLSLFPGLVNVVVVFLPGYLSNFTFTPTGFGWTQSVVQVNLLLLTDSLCYLGSVAAIIIGLFDLVSNTSFPSMKRKYTILLASFIIFQLPGILATNALTVSEFLPSTLHLGGLFQLLTLLSVSYTISIKSRRVLFPALGGDFSHVYASFLNLYYNFIAADQLGEGVFEFEGFVEKSRVDELISFQGDQITVGEIMDYEIPDLLDRNLEAFREGNVEERIVDRYLDVLNTAHQRLGRGFQGIVEGNLEYLKSSDLFYGISDGEFLSLVDEDGSLKSVNDLEACLRIYKRILLPLIHPLRKRMDLRKLLSKHLATRGLVITEFGGVSVNVIRDWALRETEDQRIPLIVEGFNGFLSWVCERLLSDPSVDVAEVLGKIRRVLSLNRDRAQELGVYSSLLETLVKAIPQSNIYDFYMDYLEEEVEERTRRLEESERRYQSLVEKEKDLIYRLDVEGRIIYASPALGAMLGYQEEEVLGLRFVDLVSEELQERARVDFQELLRRGEMANETVLIARNGNPHSVECVSQTMEDGGEMIGVVGIARDITKRRSMERSLEDHKERLSFLLENSPDIIMNLDKRGEIRYINREIRGVNGEKVVESTVFEYVNKDYQESFREALQRGFDFGESDQFECVFIDHTWWEARLIPIQRDESVVSAMLICTDITEWKRLQEQLLRSERLAAIGQLSSSVAHEIRNPLGVIKNSCYYLRTKLKDSVDRKVVKHLNIIDSEVNSANLIVSDLLDFAKKKPPVLKEVNIHELALSSLAKTAIPNNIQVVTGFDETPQMLLDREQIRRVLLNIIQNAVQAMPEGGRITLRIRVEEGEVMVSVEDTGVGIPEENLSRIFTPLFSTKAKGVGLGLTISKQIVEAHGGEIILESEVGKGSTFTIRLPLKQIVMESEG